MDSKALGLRIREQRRKHGYSQSELSQLCGLSPRYLGEIERGKRMPSMVTFLKLVELFPNASADTLLRDCSTADAALLLNITGRLQQLPPAQLRFISTLIETVIEQFGGSTDGSVGH